MDIASWFQLAVVCLLGAMSPGPSLALVIANTLTGGRVYGIVTGLGHAIGIGWWALLTAVGVGQILSENDLILLVIRFSGALLLVNIGFHSMNNAESFLSRATRSNSIGGIMLFRAAGEGFLISLFNPKIALFFLAIFSHLVNVDSDWTETGLMGMTAASVDAGWYMSVSLMLTGTSLSKFLQENQVVISRVTGAFLIVIAVYLFATTIVAILSS